MKESLRVTRTSVFIDGFNLYNGLKATSGRTHLWLDLESLARSLLKPDQVLVSVVYFTAMVRDEPEALHRQDLYLQALEASCPNVEIVRGKFQKRRVRCFECGSTRVSYEEKETDVSLAVRLVEGAARNDFDTAILLSGDADFVPAVHAVKRLQPGVRVVCVFPPQRTSDALKRVADTSFVLGRAKIAANQLPGSIPGMDRSLQRPSHWS